MNEDPEIKAIRDVRHQISRELGHDPKRILEFFTERQKQYSKDQLITFEEEPRKERVAVG